MNQLLKKYPWQLLAGAALILQTILTLNHIKFFPFSDHGIFELSLKIKDQRFYRVVTQKTSPEYMDEGILYEYHNRVRLLVEYLGVPPGLVPHYFHEDVIAIDRFTMKKNGDGPLYQKKRIYQQ